MLHSTATLALIFSVLAGEPEEIELFDGRSLNGWVAEGVSEFSKDGQTLPVWSVRERKLVCAGAGFRFLALRLAPIRRLRPSCRVPHGSRLQQRRGHTNPGVRPSPLPRNTPFFFQLRDPALRRRREACYHPFPADRSIAM